MRSMAADAMLTDFESEAIPYTVSEEVLGESPESPGFAGRMAQYNFALMADQQNGAGKDSIFDQGIQERG